MQKVYLFDSSTGEYQGEYFPQESPLEPGLFITPEFSTLLKPPLLSKNEAAIWNGAAWVKTQDFRGKIIFDKSTGDSIEVFDLGPMPAGYSMLPQTTWDSIKYERELRKIGGVNVGAKWFHSDYASRIQQLALVTMGDGLPVGLQWKTMDGSFVHMTKALANQVVTGISINDQKVFDVAETHKSKMELSDDPASYDFSTGWPKIYGE